MGRGLVMRRWGWCEVTSKGRRLVRHLEWREELAVGETATEDVELEESD